MMCLINVIASYLFGRLVDLFLCSHVAWLRYAVYPTWNCALLCESTWDAYTMRPCVTPTHPHQNQLFYCYHKLPNAGNQSSNIWSKLFIIMRVSLSLPEPIINSMTKCWLSSYDDQEKCVREFILKAYKKYCHWCRDHFGYGFSQ